MHSPWMHFSCSICVDNMQVKENVSEIVGVDRSYKKLCTRTLFTVVIKAGLSDEYSAPMGNISLTLNQLILAVCATGEYLWRTLDGGGLTARTSAGE